VDLLGELEAIEFRLVIYILFTSRRSDRGLASSRALIMSMKPVGASPENMSQRADNASTKG
jgi:hypothetical protein